MTTTTQSTPVENRYEFVYLFDVIDGNPNGDPDAGNAPRIDPETGQGLVTDVCLKRKVRNFVHLTQTEGDAPRPGFEVYVKERGVLAREQQKAYKALDKQPDGTSGTIKDARAWMCRNFYDVRTFGAVMSTGKAGDEDAEAKPAKAKGDDKKKSTGPQKLWNCGQVRGPIQLSFARSIDRILSLEHAITRVALTNADDIKGGLASDEVAGSGQFGRKMTIPYAIYRAHGFVSPYLARDTGFSKDDLDLFWKALTHMFEHDRSASRGLMSARALIVFEHASALGNHPAHLLFDRVKCEKKNSKTPARSFDDYVLTVNESSLDGVQVLSKI
ncbi:MAG TPA: type I CRISPR-associated protein Cas7 [Isosphaeraceae bacterium]|jgi:CRISPR-associated protein Csd2|nr:type I CRISPR-associated protein Cas7 [Isosphaeraceae bacterium]